MECPLREVQLSAHVQYVIKNSLLLLSVCIQTNQVCISNMFSLLYMYMYMYMYWVCNYVHVLGM